jgi:hypothetical protein
VEKVTMHEVIDASRRLFTDGRVSLTALGPVDKGRIAIDPLIFS